MTDAEEHLKSIDEQLKKGVIPPRETVRGFLLWFGASRRGYNIVGYIRSLLEQFDLETKPDFETAYIDEAIQFVRPGQYEDAGPYAADPTYRIGRLESAHRTPVSVKPESTLIQATTLMLTHDYSQLPVMTTDREVKGIISWRSIGSRLALGRNCAIVNEFMDAAQVVPIDTSLFDAINIVSEHEYVLVQDSDRTISGIVTATDLSLQFRTLAEPFLLIGEIESQVRKLIHGKFSVEELQEVRNENDPDRLVESVSDLTFGEYLRLIQPDTKWAKLKLEIDRTEFVKRCDDVREIRNDVMHFDPDGLSEDDIAQLRGFAAFLRTLRNVGAI